MIISKYRRTFAAGVLGLSLLGGAAAVVPAGAESATSATSDPSNGGHPSLGARFARMTDAQKACLTDGGLARPEGRPTGEQLEALRQSARDCDVAVPDRAGQRPAGVAAEHPGNGARFAQLTDAQKACLTDAGLARPEGRPTGPTVEQRQALRQTAQVCGIAIPAGAGNYGGRPAA